MRSLFSTPLRSALVLGLVAPALLTACSGEADDGAAPVPSFGGVPGGAQPVTMGSLQPAANNGTQQNPAVGANPANTNPANPQTNGGSDTGGQNINNNVDTGGQTDNSGGTDLGNDGQGNGNDANNGDNNANTDPVDNGNNDPVVNPAALTGRVGAELCPAGPFGDPLAGAGDLVPFARQPAGIFDFVIWEGVVWVDGALYWSAIGNGNVSNIHRQVPGQDIEANFIANSGSNGLAVDLTGNLVAASHLPMGQLSVFQLPGGARTIGNQQFEGQAFNSPNDLVIRNDGNIYFTDPDFQAGGNRPQQNNRVYRISPAGDVTEIDGSFQQPNGVTLSPDGSTLYVAGSKVLKSYPLDAGGLPGTPTTMDSELVEALDGMTVDCAGNIYVVENSAKIIRIFSPEGNRIGSIDSDEFPQSLTNVAFGGDNMRTLFISGNATQPGEVGIFTMEMNVPGMPY